MENLNYGVIGNCKSAALISQVGSLDWCCMPRFDSPSIFARLLDERRGGRFEFKVTKDYRVEQNYLPNTNILQTRFTSKKGCFEVYDFMPRYESKVHRKMYCPPDIIRYVKYVSGTPAFRVKYDPRLEYAKTPTYTTIERDYVKSSTSKGVYDSIYLYTNFNKEDVAQGKPLQFQEDCYFLISYNQKILQQSVERTQLKFERTKVYWLNWVDGTRKFRKYSKEIIRSALTLKMLTYEKTGAVLAALTTSLPETIGEVRNWDYRFCWLRDSSMVVRVLSHMGINSVAEKYLQFILNIIPDKDEKIQIMYGIEGERRLTEKVLKHLKGYAGSKPVRIGNDAWHQKQNDIYGILMDAILQQFELFKTSLAESEDLWTIIRSIVKTVEKNWQKPDKGIWEIRTEDKHFVFSKILCWVAIDRAIQVALLIEKNDYAREWKQLADTIKEDVMQNGWNQEIQSFTQFYGSEDLDASILLMESYGFIDAADERYISTVRAVEKYLQYQGLMFRYKNKDDFGVPSSSFTICTFWMINALYKIGETKKAIAIFEDLLTYSNHVGLFSEDIDFDSKRLLGNFPQAYSHLALIETACLLNGNNLSKDERILEAMHLT